jgi:hypothetical protein
MAERASGRGWSGPGESRNGSAERLISGTGGAAEDQPGRDERLVSRPKGRFMVGVQRLWSRCAGRVCAPPPWPVQRRARRRRGPRLHSASRPVGGVADDRFAQLDGIGLTTASATERSWRRRSLGGSARASGQEPNVSVCRTRYFPPWTATGRDDVPAAALLLGYAEAAPRWLGPDWSRMVGNLLIRGPRRRSQVRSPGRAVARADACRGVRTSWVASWQDRRPGARVGAPVRAVLRSQKSGPTPSPETRPTPVPRPRPGRGTPCTSR